MLVRAGGGGGADALRDARGAEALDGGGAGGAPRDKGQQPTGEEVMDIVIAGVSIGVALLALAGEIIGTGR